MLAPSARSSAVSASDSQTSATSFRKTVNARCNRDFTVPTGICSAVAVSASDSSSR